ncbi:dolichol-phosphate mannosyltransferase [Halovenus aranensis]|jgi:dolichol-phosphate mannosyltransferase|uniref:Dolichol-phosphate mannosyltransferase n=1 Tax=Halovenus aranensis TaxID=890420 RepID=A0A1G8Z1M9_9EURY|nr:S-layer glycoprotein N-glycosyltransferase AglJ [Halovenus aranensis]SDK08245.1 dolichol-phosphate mannosyltransferase [Halovenus aranensis]
MIRHEDVCVLIPTYNEAETIGDVIERFNAVGFEHILVIDGGSEDGTRQVAEDLGATVHIQSGDGKGQAVREAINYISQPYVLLVDGDSTYRPEEAGRVLAPLFTGEAEHVIGNRFADMESGAMTRLNQIGNGIINSVFRTVHGRNLVDILSGYRAFTRESFERLSLSADGFGIETEMSVECVRNNIRTEVVPITYEPRPAESETNLRPFRDGGNIIVTLYRLAKKNNPLFYFGSIGGLSILAAAGLATFVVYRWVAAGISHEVLALAAGVSLLFGVQMVMFGVLSDLILTSNREQSQRIEHLIDEIHTIEEPAGTDNSRQAGDETDDPDVTDNAGHLNEN